MRLILLRHGQTEANERRLYCGSSDPELSPAGREALLRLRAERPIDTTGLVRITSGMRRTDETMRILFDCAPDCTDFSLKEIDFGAFEGMDYERLKSVPEYQRWIADASGDLAPPGGESARAFRARVIAATERLTEDSLIVTHGGVIAALMAHWFPEEARNRWDWQPDFGHGYEVSLGVKRTYREL